MHPAFRRAADGRIELEVLWITLRRMAGYTLTLCSSGVVYIRASDNRFRSAMVPLGLHSVACLHEQLSRHGGEFASGGTPDAVALITFSLELATIRFFTAFKVIRYREY